MSLTTPQKVGIGAGVAVVVGVALTVGLVLGLPKKSSSNPTVTPSVTPTVTPTVTPSVTPAPVVSPIPTPGTAGPSGTRGIPNPAPTNPIVPTPAPAPGPVVDNALAYHVADFYKKFPEMTQVALSGDSKTMIVYTPGKLAVYNKLNTDGTKFLEVEDGVKTLKPSRVIAFGNSSFFALTRKDGVTKVRKVVIGNPISFSDDFSIGDVGVGNVAVSDSFVYVVKANASSKYIVSRYLPDDKNVLKSDNIYSVDVGNSLPTKIAVTDTQVAVMTGNSIKVYSNSAATKTYNCLIGSGMDFDGDGALYYAVDGPVIKKSSDPAVMITPPRTFGSYTGFGTYFKVKNDVLVVSVRGNTTYNAFLFIYQSDQLSISDTFAFENHGNFDFTNDSSSGYGMVARIDEDGNFRFLATHVSL